MSFYKAAVANLVGPEYFISRYPLYLMNNLPHWKAPEGRLHTLHGCNPNKKIKMHILWLIHWYVLNLQIDWFIGMLYVRRSGLVEENAVEVFLHYIVFTCPVLSWCKISGPFRENINVIVLPVSFHIFMLLVNFWFIRLTARSCPDLYPFICPPGRLLALGREGILVLGFIRSTPMLAIYDVAHSSPLGGVGRDFFFFFTSGCFIELDYKVQYGKTKCYLKLINECEWNRLSHRGGEVYIL